MFRAVMTGLSLLLATGANAAGTLYRNTGTDSGQGIVSQRWSADQFAAAADDFSVPPGQRWILEEVDVTGTYFNGSGPADSLEVTIYKATRGTVRKVGEVVASYPKLAAADEGGSFRIPIPKTRLKPGAYFVSVVVDMSFLAGGEWHWRNLLEVRGAPPEWQSPGSGGACQRWAPELKCFGPGLGDHFFTLRGEVR